MVTEQLIEVRRRMAQSVERAGRPPGSVTLVAVCKGRSDPAVLEAYEAGQRDFGENRAADLAARAERLPGDINWHFVGTLQGRKVGLVRPVTTLLHSLDRISLIERWALGPSPVPPALLQVNVAAEQQKHGFSPDEVGGALHLAATAGVPVIGLMAIPPIPERTADSRPWFEALAALRHRHAVDYPRLAELSMGMTDDFETAIEAGATIIRVGRAIFGPVEAG